MYALKASTKSNIEKCLAMSFNDIINMNSDDEDSILKPDIPINRDARKIGRGNPLLARMRFRTMEEVDAKITEMTNEKP